MDALPNVSTFERLFPRSKHETIINKWLMICVINSRPILSYRSQHDRAAATREHGCGDEEQLCRVAEWFMGHTDFVAA